MSEIASPTLLNQPSTPDDYPQVFVALGNPGSKYRTTRHNIGVLFFEHWEVTKHLAWKNKFNGFWAESEGVHYLIPQTFMNLSGQSIRALCQFYKIAPQKVCVLQDEIDLPHGALEFKFGGGLAGHNGLKSTAQELGTQDFSRIRLGVARPSHQGFQVSDWVLSHFSNAEMELLTGKGKQFERAAQGIKFWSDIKDIKKVQNKYNLKKIV